jgi:hypothetical protein
MRQAAMQVPSNKQPLAFGVYMRKPSPRIAHMEEVCQVTQNSQRDCGAQALSLLGRDSSRPGCRDESRHGRPGGLHAT